VSQYCFFSDEKYNNKTCIGTVLTSLWDFEENTIVLKSTLADIIKRTVVGGKHNITFNLVHALR